MKISELIYNLQQWKDSVGDTEVFICDDEIAEIKAEESQQNVKKEHSIFYKSEFLPVDEINISTDGTVVLSYIQLEGQIGDCEFIIE